MWKSSELFFNIFIISNSFLMQILILSLFNKNWNLSKNREEIIE